MARRRGQRKGYLYPRAGFWYLQYRVDTLDLNAVGNPVRQRLTRKIAPCSGPGKLSEREAERVAYEEVLSKLDQMSIRPGSMMTVADFVSSRWEPDVLPYLKPKTREFYGTQMRNHVLPFLGAKSLREVSLAHVQSIVNTRAKTHSPRTLEAICACISSIFNHAVRMDCFTGKIPTDGVRRPEVVAPDPVALTWEQVEMLSAALPEPASTLVLFLTMTGLRIGEACGLRWKNLDLVQGVVRVRENYVLGAYQTPKSKKGKRDIPLDPWLIPRLALLAEAAISADPMRPVFVNGKGSAPIDHHNLVKRVLKPTAAKLGLGWVAWHTFRRTFASLTDKMGLSLSQRIAMMGHYDARMTNRYTQPEPVEASRMGKMRVVN